MAGMFYSLQEAAEKLSKTEEEIKELVKQGRLREFRNGSSLLFKIDEVEALLSDTSVMASKELSTPSEPETAEEEEISLAPEEPTEAAASGSELTDADTAIASEGINVLGETDSDYQLADDTMGETKAVSEEASLEDIEEDVNLDTFGSGSGLLDFSLQADDTSLGGILDEIYTPEGEESQEATKGPEAEEAPDTKEMLSAVGIDTSQLEPEAPALAVAYVEPEPDTLSNAFGIILILPLLAIVYTAIVTIAGFNKAAPAILTTIQGIIWYIALGAIVAAGLIVGVAFVLSGTGGKVGKKKKAKKAKKKAEETPQPEAESDTE